MSWLSSLFGGGKKEDSQSKAVMPSIYMMPQYDFTEPRLRATSDFIQTNIERMQRGEYPDYYANALPTLRENLSRPNYETYYGSAGRPGVLRGQMDVGSITGLGPKKTSNLVSQSLYDYANAEKSIDEYLTKMGVDIMQRDATAFPTMSISMPKGPDAQVVYPQMVGGQTVDASGAGAAGGDLLSSLLGSMGSLFGGGGGEIPSGASEGSQGFLGNLGNLFSSSGAGSGYGGTSYQSILGNQSAPFANYGYQQPTSAQIQNTSLSDFGLWK